MQCTVNAPALLQALKSINIRYNMHAFVRLHAHEGRLTLRTCTEPPSGWREKPSVVASVSMTESLTIIAEGWHSAQYQALLDAIRMFDGPVTLRREEQAVIVERPGELKQRTPVEGTDYFPEGTAVPEVGVTYTKKEAQWGICPACGSRERKEQVDLYQIIAVSTQQVRVERERLLSMFKQVAWAVAGNDYGNKGTGVYLSLKDETLLLQASDRYRIAQRWEPLAGAEDWEHVVIIPAQQLERALRLLPKKADLHLEAVLLQHCHVKRNEEEVPDAAPFVRASEIRLSSGDMCIAIGLLNESVPDFQSIFAAQTCETQAVCATSDLRLACEAVAKVSQERQTEMQLHVNEALISVEAKHDLAPEGALHQVQAQTRLGEHVSFILVWDYLPDAIKAVSAPQVTLEFSGPGSPMVLRPTGGLDDFRCAVTTAKVFN